MRNSIICEINDGSGRECNNYLSAITDRSECIVSIMFKYRLTKIGKGCVDIKDAKASLGPLGIKTLTWEDFHSCGASRNWCESEDLTIPDRRIVNLCEETQDPLTWDISLDVSDKFDREESFPFTYQWNSFTLPPNVPVPSPVAVPAPVAMPVLSPTPEQCSYKGLKGIKFKIDPIFCQDSENSLVPCTGRKLRSYSKSDRYKFQCDGHIPATSTYPTYVQIFNKYRCVFKKTEVDLSEDTVFTLNNASKGIRVVISSGPHRQVIEFDASCHYEPLFTGDSLGSFKIVDFIYKEY